MEGFSQRHVIPLYLSIITSIVCDVYRYRRAGAMAHVWKSED